MMKRIGFCLLSIVLFALNAQGYRFICNGLLATGEERNDDCGICDAEHAARWESPTISVLVDENPRPSNITAKEWKNIVKDSLSAWENVSGTNLRFIQVQGKNPRAFGANEALHEIFWITDKEEWRLLVGSGEFDTLGATLPRYTCSADANAERVIIDSDLVLNGLRHINWQMGCDNEDCISPQTTLVHELGHFFGLDHPCLLCDNSIMSARAGFDLTHPVLDDMEGLRVLYPDGSTGGFGSSCTKDSECSDGNICVFDGTNKYCSKSCADDSTCNFGTICNENVCKFIDGDSKDARKEGENCTKVPCEQPMICAGAREPNFYCYMPCRKNADCSDKQECVNLEDENLAVCVNIKHKGNRCNHRELCDRDLYCVFDTHTSGFCRAPCTRTSTNSTGCLKDEVCELLEGRAEICLPSSPGSLNLDETSNDFDHKRNEGRFGRDEKKSQDQKVTSGCRTLTQEKLNDINPLLLLLACLGLRMIHSKTRKPYAK